LNVQNDLGVEQGIAAYSTLQFCIHLIIDLRISHRIEPFHENLITCHNDYVDYDDYDDYENYVDYDDYDDYENYVDYDDYDDYENYENYENYVDYDDSVI